MEYSFEYQDYIITIDIEAGFDYDDPVEWTIKSIEYVDGEPCSFEQLSAVSNPNGRASVTLSAIARQEIESACESWASAKAYDAWIDRATVRADYLIDAAKDS